MTIKEPRIETLSEKKLVGKKLKMTFVNNKTGELWRSFMVKRNEIRNTINTDLISMQIYPKVFDFNPNAEFEKWATAETLDHDNIPKGMESYILKRGLYAIFHYKGSSEDNRIFKYIFETWLPNSNYILDDRPHFEILGEKYKNKDKDSEEEIYIPIKEK